MIRFLILALSLISNAVLAESWEQRLNNRIDQLAIQLNDGWSTEVRDARKIYSFSESEATFFAGMISIEGQHGGNANVEYLAVYESVEPKPTPEAASQNGNLMLVGLAIVGGRGQRMVDFDSLRYENHIFTLKAMGYKNDPMCCPSNPLTLKYTLSFYGLSPVES